MGRFERFVCDGNGHLRGSTETGGMKVHDQPPALVFLESLQWIEQIKLIGLRQDCKVGLVPDINNLRKLLSLC
jgi:hypothetical protein